MHYHAYMPPCCHAAPDVVRAVAHCSADRTARVVDSVRGTATLRGAAVPEGHV